LIQALSFKLNQWQGKIMKKKRLLMKVVVIILIGAVIYYGRGFLLVSRAEKVYHNADCDSVMRTATTLQQQYPTFIAPFIEPSPTWVEVCQAFLSTEAKHRAGEWQIVYKEFTEFLDIHGETPLAPVAQTLLHESLFNWAAEQRQNGQYEAALNTYELIKAEDEEIKAKVKNEQTEVYFEWADAQRKTGQYEAALKTYELIKTYDSETQAKIKKGQTQVHLAQAADEKKNGNTRQAEDLLTALWDTQEIDPQQAASVGFTDAELMNALSRSTGAYAHKLMDDAVSAVCTDGRAGESAALAVSETRQAMIRGVADELPDDLQAITPGNLHYAVCIERREHEVEKCAYTLEGEKTPTAYILRKLIRWDVVIRDIRTGKTVDSTTIDGFWPRECSDKTSFEKKDESRTYQGSEPEFRALEIWLRGEEPAHTDIVNVVSFNSDGQLLASGARDGTVKLWEIPSGKLLQTLEGHTDNVSTVSFYPVGNFLASGSRDGTIRLWRPGLWEKSSWTLLKTLDNNVTSQYGVINRSDIKSFAFSPDGKFLISGVEESFPPMTRAKFWEMPSGTELKIWKGHEGGGKFITLSPDGKLLASEVREMGPLYYAKSEGLPSRYPTLEGNDEKSLLPEVRVGPINLYEMPSGTLIKKLEGHSQEVLSLAFSSDSKLLASGGEDQTVRLWDISSGTVVNTLTGHTGSVNTVAFSPDGTLLASGADDATIKLWAVPSGELVKTLEGHRYAVNSVAFKPDGTFLVSGGADGKIKLWQMPLGRLMRDLADPMLSSAGRTWSLTFQTH
jgi:WD40 repeat protein/tetratricopeptide (TPR) repeat protein